MTYFKFILFQLLINVEQKKKMHANNLRFLFTYIRKF